MPKVGSCPAQDVALAGVTFARVAAASPAQLTNLREDLVKVRAAVAGRRAQAGQGVLPIVVVDNDVAHLQGCSQCGRAVAAATQSDEVAWCGACADAQVGQCSPPPPTDLVRLQSCRKVDVDLQKVVDVLCLQRLQKILEPFERLERPASSTPPRARVRCASKVSATSRPLAACSPAASGTSVSRQTQKK